MDHPTAHMRPQEGRGPQPQHPQYSFQPSHPQALLHPHAPTCPVATAAQTTCPHARAPPDCAACQLFTHAEAAHNGWLQTLCICEAHNPNPRMNTPAGRHKLEEAVRRSGDRELVALSWARGTISSLAQIIDANLERVLQARVVAGRDSLTEDDVRVVNEAGELMACIMPHLADTQGSFWINDKSLLIPVQDFGLPAALKRQRHPHAADRHSQQSRQARLAFNDFERRVLNDLLFLDRERWYFEQLVPEGERERLARDHARTQQPYLNQKHEEAQRLAWTSMREEDQLEGKQELEVAAQQDGLLEDDLRMEQLLEKHELERERLRQKHRAPSFAFAVNGPSASPFAATPTAPGISASKQHAGAQPRVTVPVPAKTRTCEEVQARLKFLGQPPCSQAVLQKITATLNAQLQQEEQSRREMCMDFQENSSQTSRGSSSDGNGPMTAETAGSYGLRSPSSRSENEWMDVVIEK